MKQKSKGVYDKYIFMGGAASIALLGFYFIVASLLGGTSFALDNFRQLWYWMIPLIIGFGIQLGMFFYVKDVMHKKATAQAAASTGISTTSMIACCAHHIADIAPFLGISILGILLTKYQSTFLLAGILSNILGITYMISMLKTRVSRFKIKILFYSLLILSIIAVFASYYYVSNYDVSKSENEQIYFQTLISNENDVEFQVTPLSLSEFQITINTHSVALDFDLVVISVLYDNTGRVYKPLKWEGSSPGGHHRSGILKFQPVDKNAKSIKLIITDSTEREFIWNVKWRNP